MSHTLQVFDILEQAAVHLLPLQRPPHLQLKAKDLGGPPPLVMFLNWVPAPPHLRPVILERSAAAGPVDTTFAFKAPVRNGKQGLIRDGPPAPPELEVLAPSCVIC